MTPYPPLPSQPITGEEESAQEVRLDIVDLAEPDDE